MSDKKKPTIKDLQCCGNCRWGQQEADADYYCIHPEHNNGYENCYTVCEHWEWDGISMKDRLTKWGSSI